MNDISRRNFMFTSFGVATGAFLLPGCVNAQKKGNVYEGGLVTGHAKPLPYKSIPGFLSEEQISPHYTAHYGGALRGYVAADKQLQADISEGTVIDSRLYGAIQRARTNKANSVVLHELYFDGMTSKVSNPTGDINTAIKKRFGSIEKWAADFQASAKAATGWAMLAIHPLNGKLYNIVSDKHATGVLWMATPLVVIDVYEHAFYVDYKNNKTLYINKFMQHIDWEEVSRRYKGIS
ncbi:MAG: superoxide dismutase [Methyloprofundus sp.]|nr:superoxide dismutase [Methyloprofundus sp.]